MRKDERDLLEVLRFELDFLEKGGYGRAPRASWRPQFIFEDSPTCMNYDCKEIPTACSDCVLMHLVPPERRAEKIPCRHIPLGQTGETLDSLYRYGDQHEIEESVGNWLRATIARLEEERRVVHRDESKHHTPSGNIKGTPLHHNLHPKCANPACPTAFHWLAGGKFFRFRPNQDSNTGRTAADSTTGLHGVKHFWLCERCSHPFTLLYEEKFGIVLKLRGRGLPLSGVRKELSAA